MTLRAAAALTVLTTSIATAQDQRLLSGSVRDSQSRDLLQNVSILVVQPSASTQKYTAAAGSFRINVPNTPFMLVATRVGFRPETLAVAATDSMLQVTLRRARLELSPVVVASERTFSTASASAIRELDVLLRPRESAQELLRLAPGLVIAQHGGGGKAEQIFLRGFDADHGTDVAISVDGSPVNMVSHGHGQGYADLHFLLPEVVERIDVRKGPYSARDGDFATAGAVSFATLDRIAAPVFSLRGGSFGSARFLGMLPFGAGADRSGGFVAASTSGTDGPFDIEQDYRRNALFGKWTAPVGDGAEVFSSLSGFDARWNQSGQVPGRAVADRSISRFGSIDSTEGGRTARYDASVGIRSGGSSADPWEVRIFAARYSFELFSNFTFFLNDPVAGDGIYQSDDRFIAGAHGNREFSSKLLGFTGRTAIGASARFDRADVTLSRQVNRSITERTVDAHVNQATLSSWLERSFDVTSTTRIQLGLRGDVFRFAVQDRMRSASVPPGAPADSDRWMGVVSPKFNVAQTIGAGTELFVNAGLGFHSNDARDVIASSHTDRVLPRAFGSEVGVRHTWYGGSIGVAAWNLDLQSELVYVGDEGVTEPNGRTRRTGIDVEARHQLTSWLWADADLNLSRGRFRDLAHGENLIPLAPTFTSTGGLTVREVGPWSGGLRYRHIATRAANEDYSVAARGYSVLETFASWTRGRITVVGAIDNLANVEWNEAQFATTSRLRGEPGEVTENNFTPGAPRAFTLGLQVRW